MRNLLFLLAAVPLVHCGTFGYIYTDWFSYDFSDSGSGAHDNLRIYKLVTASDRISLGCLATDGSADPQFMLALNGGEENIDYKQPTDFTRMWYDKNTGSNTDFSFWNPTCPEGFVPLGAWAHKSWGEPALNVMNCVNETYTRKSEVGASAIWTDKYSGGSNDGSAWVIANDNGLAWFEDSYSRPTDAVYSPPEIKYATWEVDVDALAAFSSTPKILDTYTHDNKGDEEAEYKKKLETKITESYSQTQTSGFELSISSTVSFSIPFVKTGGEVTTGSSTSMSFEDAQEHSAETTMTDQITCMIPPWSQIIATFGVWSGEGSLPFHGHIEFVNGMTSEISGTYTGTSYGDKHSSCEYTDITHTIPTLSCGQSAKGSISQASIDSRTVTGKDIGHQYYKFSLYDQKHIHVNGCDSDFGASLYILKEKTNDAICSFEASGNCGPLECDLNPGNYWLAIKSDLSRDGMFSVTMACSNDVKSEL